MKSTCRRKFLSQLAKIKQKVENQSCTQAVLIMDDKGTLALKQIVNVSNLLDQGIKNLTKINLNKKPEPNAIGIYFIGEESVKMIQKDFQKKPTYFSINILVCETISEQTMKFVANSEKIMQRLATFTQFHFPVRYFSQRLAILPNSDNYLKSVYQQLGYISQEIGQKVFEMITASFNNLSHVQLFYSDQSKFGIAMANRVYKCFQEYQDSLIQQQNQLTTLKNKKNQESDDITVIFFDRNIDYVSPMVRNYYYFPLIADMFDIRDFKNLTIQKLNKQVQEIKIEYDEKIFMQYKNKHVSEAITQITRDLERFTASNKAAQFQKQKQGTFNNKNLKEIMKQFPEYSKTVKSYNLHIQIMRQISTKNKRQRISQFGQLQHLIITSLTSLAQVQKDRKIFKKALQMLTTVNDTQVKARIIFLMLECLQINQKQKQDLLAFYDKTPGYEGFSMIFQRPVTGKLRYNPLYKKQSIFLDRHQCIIAKRTQQIMMQKPCKQFKKLQTQVSSQGKFSKFKKLQKRSKKKLLIVMIGGLSVNQLSNIERVVQKSGSHQVYFLTDHVTTPKTYLQDLKLIFRQKS